MTAVDTPVPAGGPQRRARGALLPLRVAAVERLTDTAVAIDLEVPAELADDFAFTQGQHVSVVCPDVDGERRSYSICSPAGSGRLRIAVKAIPGGAFSAHALTGLAVGDILEVMAPAGRFNVALDPALARRHVMVAAGSGITPIISLAATTLAVETASQVTLLYGNRTTADIMFLEDLEALKNLYPARLQVFHILSREDQDAELLNGRIDAARFARFLDGPVPPDSVDEWFLCGPVSMVEGLREVLRDRGVDLRHVHAELFHADLPATVASADIAPAAGTRLTLTLDGRTTTTVMTAAHQNVLDAVLAVRRDAPFACRGGVCGTCRARVVSGRVTMAQRWALEDDEIAAGVVLTCQSRPLDDHLVVDYDA